MGMELESYQFKREVHQDNVYSVPVCLLHQAMALGGELLALEID
jgi:hypothetical protein